MQHLEEDASFIQCNKCGRRSYTSKVNSICSMPQPIGSNCDGLLVGHVDAIVIQAQAPQGDQKGGSAEMTAKEFIDLIIPEHDRTSCSDDNQVNALFSRAGTSWHGRCTRCMYLEILEDRNVPEGFEHHECMG